MRSQTLNSTMEAMDVAFRQCSCKLPHGTDVADDVGLLAYIFVNAAVSDAFCRNGGASQHICGITFDSVSAGQTRHASYVPPSTTRLERATPTCHSWGQGIAETWTLTHIQGAYPWTLVDPDLESIVFSLALLN